MVQLILGSLFLLFGAPFLIRGWLFSLFPDHPITLRAKERNLRLGLEVDMKRWGRRVRRFGLLVCGLGGALAAWGYWLHFGGA